MFRQKMSGIFHKGDMTKINNKEKALTALLNSSTITDAAAASGLSERTLYRYLEEGDFKKQFRSARREMVEHSITEIQKATTEAVETLRRNLYCENPSVEVRTAQIILDTAYKGTELLDILERLETLETEQSERAQNDQQ